MTWLLAAEARKLARPLVWGSALATIAFLVLLTWAATSNARRDLASPRIPDVCAAASTPQCRAVISRAHADALTAAYARSYQQLAAQTKLLAFMDCFHTIGVITLLAAPLVLLTKHFRASARGGGGH